MPNNFYQQFFSAQKAMFDQWQIYMKEAFSSYDTGSATEIMEFYNKMFEASQDFWQKAYDQWQNSLQTAFPNMSQNFSFNPLDYYDKISESTQDFWKKTAESYKSYQAVQELWRKISAPNWNAKDLIATYETWVKEWASLIRDNFMPNMPSYVKNFTEKMLTSTVSAASIGSDNMRAWTAKNQDLRDAFVRAMEDPSKGYREMLDIWQKMYEDSFGKFMNAPSFGRDMKFWSHQKAAFDRFIKFNISTTRFYTAIYEVAEEATKKVLNNYIDMLAKGTQPKTFDEFYKYWAKVISASYDKVLLSEEISQMSGNMVNAMSKYKIESDRLWEFYLTGLPLPRKTDMASLYKTIYDLKKELRAVEGSSKENKTNE